MILRGNIYRLIGKNTDLYVKRNKFCESCPFSSKHRKLTFLEKVWRVLGEFCTECGCPLQSKLREPLSECPHLKWGQEL
jgi:ribosomal protein L37E